jgi:hypothetical protein
MRRLLGAIVPLLAVAAATPAGSLEAESAARACRVPDLLHKLLPQRDLLWAIETIVRSGCSTGAVQVDGAWDLGGLRVAAQTPDPGSTLAARSRVHITLEYVHFSRPGGPAHGFTRDSTPPASPRACVVPSVKGKRPVPAVEEVTRSGCSTKDLRGCSRLSFTTGRVTAQSPPAGRRLARNARVTLTLRAGSG